MKVFIKTDSFDISSMKSAWSAKRSTTPAIWKK